jgi:hypothetical protein
VFCGRNGGDGTWDAGEGVMWPGEGRRGGGEREAQRDGAGHAAGECPAAGHFPAVGTVCPAACERCT